MPPRQEELFENDVAVPNEENSIIAVCDPYSTGCLVVKEMEKRGCTMLAIWSKESAEELKLHIPRAAGTMTYIAEVNEADSHTETVHRIKRACGARPLKALIPGGESGVDLADALSELLGLPSNGTEISNRRDKKVQQDLIRQKRLRAIREAYGSIFCDVEDFLKNESYPLVLKPLDSAGSDGVKAVHSFQEAKEHFEHLIGSTMVNGAKCEAVLCQEELVGMEYVVDFVSCEGHHKLMMIWKYDKRAVNGANFVYFGIIPVEMDSPEARMLVPYMSDVLDAIGMKYGATHGEVIITEYGPCLVEVNCRANGGDGNWRPLAQLLTGGYSQVEATADAYLDRGNFFCLPDIPPTPLKAHGQEVKLVSYANGKVKALTAYEEIKQMDSFLQIEPSVQVGDEVKQSIDLATAAGSVILRNSNKEAFDRDYNRIRELERSNQLFEFES